MTTLYDCATCTARTCIKGGEALAACPMRRDGELIGDTIHRAKADFFARQVMAAAAHTPRNADGTTRARVDEIIAFCRSMGWQTVGVAFCIMFAKEARTLTAQLEDAGLQLVPVCCKVGGVDLPALGVDVVCDVKGTACNPMTQAALLNAQQTDLNIALGLCVGHDLLFAKHAEAPVTTLVVKDRALQHHPLSGLRARTEGAR